MADAGTKYLAISLSSLSGALLFGLIVIFRIMMPSKHFCPASNTPDPECGRDIADHRGKSVLEHGSAPARLRHPVRELSI